MITAIPISVLLVLAIPRTLQRNSIVRVRFATVERRSHRTIPLERLPVTRVLGFGFLELQL